jgi:hypothetical protein
MVPKERGHFGIPRRRWDVNIKTDIKAVEWEGVICIDLFRDRDRDKWWAAVNRAMKLRILQKVDNFFTS